MVNSSLICSHLPNQYVEAIISLGIWTVYVCIRQGSIEKVALKKEKSITYDKLTTLYVKIYI